jgi:hypothetical protein
MPFVRLEKSIEANKMGLVARASASAGAAALGVTIPCNTPLDDMAKELDPIFECIVAGATE